MVDIETHEGAVWERKTRIEKCVLSHLTLKGVDLNHPIFKDVNFENCTFDKTLFHDARLYNCNFNHCHFVNIDLRTATIGAHGGTYCECSFVKCDFRGGFFYFPHFNQCLFEHCKLKRIDFNDSSFINCKFVGKMEDVTFNGMNHENKTGFAPLHQVDFSEAIFGEFVSFENCDLSKCLPPKGSTFDQMLYEIFPSKPWIRSTGSKDRIILGD